MGRPRHRTGAVRQLPWRRVVTAARDGGIMGAVLGGVFFGPSGALVTSLVGAVAAAAVRWYRSVKARGRMGRHG